VKYAVREGVKEKLHPGLLVPHPKNRGNDPVGPQRLRELGGTIVEVGYDWIEANTNVVCVQQKPDDQAGTPYNFQREFSQALKGHHEIAEFGPGGMHAQKGSLSHSHLNCLFRNMLSGVVGCDCVGTARSCTCKARPILNGSGNYCMDLLQGHDKDWYTEVCSGLEWEVLSWKMDVEEPEAALTISIALNKRNEAAMKTGHLEILATMIGLANPDPLSGAVLYEPIRDRLIDLYGPCADNAQYIWCFRFVLAQGGSASPWLERLKNFTSNFVNQKLRKLPLEVYERVEKCRSHFRA